MKNEAELNSDDKFAKTLAHTLDKSLADIDDLNLQRLKNARANAFINSAQLTYSSPKWTHFAVAASLIMLIAAPVLWQQHNAQQFNDADAEFISQEMPPAAQELDDMDMLLAMDDADA